MKSLLPILLLTIATGCKFNSSGWPIIPFMHNGVPISKPAKQKPGATSRTNAVSIAPTTTPKTHSTNTPPIPQAAPLSKSRMNRMAASRALMPAGSTTNSVTLAWDDNESESGVLASYNIYQRPDSGALPTVWPVTPASVKMVTISPLELGVVYYFTATAVGTNGLESAPSEEISYTLPGGPPRFYITVQPQMATSLSGPFENFGSPIAVLTNRTPAFLPEMFFRLDIERRDYVP